MSQGKCEIMIEDKISPFQNMGLLAYRAKGKSAIGHKF